MLTSQQSATALGVHVFMGALTAGVMESFNVKAQLETFDLGEKTVEHNLKIPFIHAPAFDGKPSWRDVADGFHGVDLVYGNPRCTGFSALGHGCSEDAHGAWAAPTIDMRQLFEVASWLRPTLICAESVQQFGTVGRALMEWLVEKHGDGYRVAEGYHNAAMFGNAQHRRRVFFIFYREDLQLPVYEVTEQLLHKDRHRVIFDVIGGYWNTTGYLVDEALAIKGEKTLYDYSITQDDLETWRHGDLRGHYYETCDYEDVQVLYPLIKEDWSLNDISTEDLAMSCERLHRVRKRGSSFSFHATRRLHRYKHCPVIYSGSGHYLHPEFDRPLTVLELQRLMGFDEAWTVLGPAPISQLGKGVCLQVARWIGSLLKASLTGAVKRVGDPGERWEQFHLDDSALGWVPRKPILSTT